MSRRRLVWFSFALVLVLVGVAIALDPDARVQGWMKHEPFYDGRSATAWRRELRNPDPVIANRASESLLAGKGQAVPVCAYLIRHDSESQVRSRVVDVLLKMGKEAAPAGADLVAALKDPDPLVRAGAARAIGGLAPEVPGAVPALMELFPERDAIRAVADFKAAGAEAVPKLTELTKHADTAVRRQAVRALGKIGEPALSALPNLIALTTGDPESGVREQSAEAIGDIGPAAAAGIPALVAALRDENKMVRRDAVRSLGQMGSAAKGVLADVKALMNDPEEEVKTAATKAARLIEPGGK